MAGRSLYCDETGGDYYDYIELPNRSLGVVVGDVSGHGVSAALLMASVRGYLRARATLPGSASDIITGKARFKEVVRQNAGLESEGIRKAVFEAVTGYRGDEPQEDDITLVVLKFSQNNPARLGWN